MHEPTSASRSLPPAELPLPPSRNPVRRLYEWTLRWASTPYGVPALCVLSFAESSFFPVPPDALLAPLCFARPQRWWRYALYCSISSVLGGILGWWIGAALWDLTQGFFFRHVPGFTPEIFELVRQRYNDNAFLAILLAAFTPIPYKVFTIASGVFDVGLGLLVLASVLGRSARFFLLAGLIRVCGPRLRPHLERNLELAVVALCVLALLGFLAIKWLA